MIILVRDIHGWAHVWLAQSIGFFVALLFKMRDRSKNRFPGHTYLNGLEVTQKNAFSHHILGMTGNQTLVKTARQIYYERMVPITSLLYRAESLRPLISIQNSCLIQQFNQLMIRCREPGGKICIC